MKHDIPSNEYLSHMGIKFLGQSKVRWGHYDVAKSWMRSESSQPNQIFRIHTTNSTVWKLLNKYSTGAEKTPWSIVYCVSCQAGGDRERVSEHQLLYNQYLQWTYLCRMSEASIRREQPQLSVSNFRALTCIYIIFLAAAAAAAKKKNDAATPQLYGGEIIHAKNYICNKDHEYFRKKCLYICQFHFVIGMDSTPSLHLPLLRRKKPAFWFE